MSSVSKDTSATPTLGLRIVKATGEEPMFKAGDSVKVMMRYPVGHYRVPTFVRGKRGTVETLIKTAGINNEEEGFGRNAGLKGYYYRVAIPMTELWPDYIGSAQDGLRIEIFETWLERI
jgi:hypothetical protein